MSDLPSEREPRSSLEDFDLMGTLAREHLVVLVKSIALGGVINRSAECSCGMSLTWSTREEDHRTHLAWVAFRMGLEHAERLIDRHSPVLDLPAGRGGD